VNTLEEVAEWVLGCEWDTEEDESGAMQCARVVRAADEDLTGLREEIVRLRAKVSELDLATFDPVPRLQVVRALRATTDERDPEPTTLYPCDGCGQTTRFAPCEVCGQRLCQDCGPCLPERGCIVFDPEPPVCKRCGGERRSRCPVSQGEPPWEGGVVL